MRLLTDEEKENLKFVTGEFGLGYIAASPAMEHGGFHPNAVATAKMALEIIARIQEERDYWKEAVRSANFRHCPAEGDSFCAFCDSNLIDEERFPTVQFGAWCSSA